MLVEEVPCTGRRAWPSAYRGRDVACPHGVHGASRAWEGLPPSAHGTPALPWGVPLGTLDPRGPAWILPDGCLPTASSYPQPLCRPASRMGPSRTAWHPDKTRSSLFDGSLLLAKSVRSANAAGCALDRSGIQPALTDPFPAPAAWTSAGGSSPVPASALHPVGPVDHISGEMA